MGVISRRQPSPSSGVSPARSTQENGHSSNAKGKSYKDIHISRRSVTPGPGNSSNVNNKPQVTRSITPGPYERRNLQSSNSTDTNSPLTSRRALFKQPSVGKFSSGKGPSSPAPVRRTSSVADVNDQTPFMLTNEITFSDDEEINELVMNSAKMKAAQTPSDNRVSS